MLEVFALYMIKYSLKSIPCQDEFLVQMQEEFSNQPVDRTDDMVATGLLDSNPQ